MYFADLKRVDQDIRYLENRLNLLVGVVTILILFFEFGASTFFEYLNLNYKSSHGIFRFFMSFPHLISLFAMIIPSSNLRLVEKYFPRESERFAWLYKRTVVAMWIILMSAVISSASKFILGVTSSNTGGQMIYFACLSGAIIYPYNVIRENKTFTKDDISAAFGRMKWFCALLVLHYLVAALMPQIRELIPDEYLSDSELFSTYTMIAGYVLMLVGIIVSYLNPDSVSKWLDNNSLPLTLPDSPEGKLAKRAMLSAICFMFAPLIAFMYFLFIGSMIHLNITVPVTILLSFWAKGRAEDTMIPSFPPA